MEFNQSELKIIAEIAKEQDLDEEVIKETISLQFKVLEQVFKRGVNIDICGIEFKVCKQGRGVLRKQRIGDQKAVIDCIRFDKKITAQRQQTFLKVQQLKNGR